jgi:hypothetical protein
MIFIHRPVDEMGRIELDADIRDGVIFANLKASALAVLPVKDEAAAWGLEEWVVEFPVVKDTLR